MNPLLESAPYLLRDDSMFCHFCCPPFVRDLAALIEECSGVKVTVFSAREQVEFCQDKIGTNVLSLDKWFQGDFNLDISRLFSWGTNELLSHHIENYQEFKDWIKDKDFINIVDDDIVTGSTIKKVVSEIKSDYKIWSLDELFSFSEKYDICDVRDFVPGAKHGGLKFIDDSGIFRFPYLHPYVNLEKRMRLLPDKCEYFSIQLIKLWRKYDFYRNWTFLYKPRISERGFELFEKS